jgi:hypothetical protein
VSYIHPCSWCTSSSTFTWTSDPCFSTDDSSPWSRRTVEIYTFACADVGLDKQFHCLTCRQPAVQKLQGCRLVHNRSGHYKDKAETTVSLGVFQSPTGE